MNDSIATAVRPYMETWSPAPALNGTNLSTWNDNSSLQYTAGGAEPMTRLAKGIVTLLYATVIVVALGGNVGVCCIVATQRRMHTVTNLFIASLATSDVMMASLCIPLTFVSDVIVQYWPFPQILCPIALYVQVSQRAFCRTSVIELVMQLECSYFASCSCQFLTASAVL